MVILWKKTSTGGVRTHADIRPLELKSNALTTRPPYFMYNFGRKHNI